MRSDIRHLTETGRSENGRRHQNFWLTARSLWRLDAPQTLHYVIKHGLFNGFSVLFNTSTPSQLSMCSLKPLQAQAESSRANRRRAHAEQFLKPSEVVLPMPQRYDGKIYAPLVSAVL